MKKQDLKSGNIAQGASHENGGIKTTTPSGPLEIEGGEAVINKEATAENCELLSQINQSAGNGVAFTCDKAEEGKLIENKMEQDEIEKYKEEYMHKIVNLFKKIGAKHNGTFNYAKHKEDGTMDINFDFPTKEDERAYQAEIDSLNNTTLQLKHGGKIPNEMKTWHGIPITMSKLKEMFDEDALNDIKELEDFTGVSVDAKNGKEYDVRFQNGVYLIDSNETASHGKKIESHDLDFVKGKYLHIYSLGDSDPLIRKITDVKITPDNFEKRFVTIIIDGGYEEEIPLSKYMDFISGEEVKVNDRSGHPYILRLAIAKHGTKINEMKNTTAIWQGGLYYLKLNNIIKDSYNNAFKIVGYSKTGLFVVHHSDIADPNMKPIPLVWGMEEYGQSTFEGLVPKMDMGAFKIYESSDATKLIVYENDRDKVFLKLEISQIVNSYIQQEFEFNKKQETENLIIQKIGKSGKASKAKKDLKEKTKGFNDTVAGMEALADQPRKKPDITDAIMLETQDAYMRESYGDMAWRVAIGHLIDLGYSEKQIIWILKSKIMRWSDDEFGRGNRKKKNSGTEILAYRKKYNFKDDDNKIIVPEGIPLYSEKAAKGAKVGGGVPQTLLIKFRTKDGFGNKSTMGVVQRQDNTIGYSFFGGWQSSGIPFAISNLQLKKSLPSTVKGFKNVKALRDEIQNIINTGVERVDHSEILNEISKTKKGIINQYEGKSAEEVWNAWNKEQKTHFLEDHNTDKSYPIDKKDLERIIGQKFNEITEGMRDLVRAHVATGQYKYGGKVPLGFDEWREKESKAGRSSGVANYSEYLKGFDAKPSKSDKYKKLIGKSIWMQPPYQSKVSNGVILNAYQQEDTVKIEYKDGGLTITENISKSDVDKVMSGKKVNGLEIKGSKSKKKGKTTPKRGKTTLSERNYMKAHKKEFNALKDAYPDSSYKELIAKHKKTTK